MGFAAGFAAGQAAKFAKQRLAMEEKLNALKMREIGLQIGQMVDQRGAQKRLLTPDSSPSGTQDGFGPPAPEEQGILARLARGQTDTVNDALRSGLLDEIGKLQKVQQGPSPFSPEGKESGDLVSFMRRFGAKSPEVEDLKKRLDTAGTSAAKMSDISSLRGQYIAQSKDNLVALSSFDKLNQMAQDPSGAGDVGMIFAFMKQLDPGSRVTEGETALASDVSGAASKFLNIYNRLVLGERLTPSARKDILFQAAGLAKSTIDEQRDNDKSFGGVATRSKIDPRDVAIFTERILRTEKSIAGIKKPSKSLEATVKEAESTLEKATSAIKGIVSGQPPSEVDDIVNMSAETLSTLDLDKLPPEARKAAEARINQLLESIK